MPQSYIRKSNIQPVWGFFIHILPLPPHPGPLSLQAQHAAQEQYAPVGYEHAQQMPQDPGQQEGNLGDLQQQQQLQMQPPGETLVEKRKRLGR